MKSVSSKNIEKPAVCPLDCADTCSLTVTVKDGELQSVRGSSLAPFTRGKICAKVATGLVEQVHGADRILTPLRRVGERGKKSSFEAISWPEALERIHERFTRDIEQWGPQSIVPLTYGGPMGLLAGNSIDKRFFNKLGARKVDSSPLCAGVSGAAYESLFGDVGGIAPAELADSSLIVVWGNNITACNLHLTTLLRDAQKRGAKLVVIDPKRIRIAADADLHLPINPGTDVVLAYAVAAELHRQGALDYDFIARNVSGCDAYLAEAGKYSLQMAADTCGLALGDIQEFVACWRDTSPAGLIVGVGPERNRNGGSGIRAAMALPALTGNIGPAGAGICDPSGFFPTDGAKLHGHHLYTEPGEEISVLDIPDLVLDPAPGDVPVKSLFIYNHNPVAVHPRQAMMQTALLHDEIFIVGCDISMTDSMRYADIVLPAASHLEISDLYKSYGQTFLQRSRPAIDPVGEALPNTEIFRRLASQFGYSDTEFDDSDETLIAQAIDPGHPAMAGRSAALLNDQLAVDCRTDADGNPVPTLLRGLEAGTPSGKIELFDARLEAGCGQGLPTWTPMADDYRFTLVSPSSEKRINSTFGGVTGHDSDVVLEMNPRDAENLQLREGETVRVFNAQGSVNLPLKVSTNIKQGTLYSPKGAWLKNATFTINALIPGHKADIAGGACYNDTRVNVEAYQLENKE